MIICQLIVHLLVVVQNTIKYICLLVYGACLRYVMHFSVTSFIVISHIAILFQGGPNVPVGEGTAFVLSSGAPGWSVCQCL